MCAFFKELRYNSEHIFPNLKENVLQLIDSNWTSFEELEKMLEMMLGLDYGLDLVEIGICQVASEFDFMKFLGESYEVNSDISALVVAPSNECTLLIDVRYNGTGGFLEESEDDNPFGLNSLEMLYFEE